MVYVPVKLLCVLPGLGSMKGKDLGKLERKLERLYQQVAIIWRKGGGTSGLYSINYHLTTD